MPGIMWGTSIETVTATCGHEVWVEIPPYKYRIGTVGLRRIDQAKNRPCYDCRKPDES